MLAFAFNTARCDVIFFPFHYSLISYSFEAIVSYEKTIRPNTTLNYWAGGGMVSSFLYIDEPAFGVEGAVERRWYFKKERYKGLNFSGYCGTALMYNSWQGLNLGIVPGIKLTHKSLIKERLLVEPYISVSIPVSYNLKHTEFWLPFPVATVGLRVGIHKWIK